jgi:hypothetical protein
MARKTAEDGNYVFRGLVGFVDDDHTAKHNSPEKRRVRVIDYTIFQRGREHQLVDGGITM